MNVFRVVITVALVAMTSGCATIMNGGGQTISVNTTPMGASCTLDRNGQRIGAITSTPGTFAVDKSRKTIVVTCEKPGYQPVMASNQAHSTYTVIGNVIFGGLIGLIVDESTGDDFEYASNMNIEFPAATSPYGFGPRMSENAASGRTFASRSR